MRTHRLAIAMATAFVLMVPARALADITGFIGVSPTPSSRALRGAAFGVTLLVVGFELEYAHTSEDIVAGAPSLRTGMVNGLVQTPGARTQLYLTLGGGFYRESLGGDGHTGFGTNIGGGAKLGLVGPLRLRLDYRVFTLRGDPLHTTVQRFYAGANVSF